MGILSNPIPSKVLASPRTALDVVRKYIKPKVLTGNYLESFGATPEKRYNPNGIIIRTRYLALTTVLGSLLSKTSVEVKDTRETQNKQPSVGEIFVNCFKTYVNLFIHSGPKLRVERLGVLLQLSLL